MWGFDGQEDCQATAGQLAQGTLPVAQLGQQQVVQQRVEVLWKGRYGGGHRQIGLRIRLISARQMSLALIGVATALRSCAYEEKIREKKEPAIVFG